MPERCRCERCRPSYAQQLRQGRLLRATERLARAEEAMADVEPRARRVYEFIRAAGGDWVTDFEIRQAVPDLPERIDRLLRQQLPADQFAMLESKTGPGGGRRFGG